MFIYRDFHYEIWQSTSTARPGDEVYKIEVFKPNWEQLIMSRSINTLGLGGLHMAAKGFIDKIIGE